MPINTSSQAVEATIDAFARTTEQVFSLEELRHLLTCGRQLRMKYGVDVTAPHLHIGHAVNLWMYRQLQELGHRIIFLIGDFTTQIGDPTGRNKTRPVLPQEEIQRNADAFIEQALMVLHGDEELVEIRRNSEWFDKTSAKEFLSLLSMVTHERLIGRDMFQRRIESQQEIYLHEMIYPVLQGYDSVMLEADLTVIGSDQLFNEMMGRFFQAKFGQPGQVIITTKITPGTDGKHKQSKSLDNYIGLAHAPREKFGRLMSIPDELIVPYFEVYTDVPQGEIESVKAAMGKSPMDCKLALAEAVVARYHGQDVGRDERQWFVDTFSRRQTPEDVPRVQIGSEVAEAFAIVRRCLNPSTSNSQIRRLFEQGGIKFNKETVKPLDHPVRLPADLSVGKRKWFRVEP